MDRDTEEDVPAPQSKPGGTLKLAARYTMLGFAPVVSVVALVVAVIAVGHDRAASPQSGEAAARIESLGASMTETKNELESLKFTLARERSQRAEERKRAEEREAAIVQHVSRLQTRLKVAPTLEEQLKAADRAPVHAAPAPTPVAGETVHAVTAAPAVAVTEPAAAPAAVAADKTHAAPTTVEKKPVAVAPPATEKTPAQLKALKDAIDKLNKK